MILLKKKREREKKEKYKPENVWRSIIIYNSRCVAQK